MKLYDVIRKDYKEKGITDLEKPLSSVPQPVHKRPVVQEEKPTPVHQEYKKRPTSWRKLVVIGGALFFIGVLYLIGIYFVHATVIVTPRKIPFSLQGQQIDIPNQLTSSLNTLSFQTMVVTDNVSRQVNASAATTSATRAIGKAVVLNEYSKNAQTIKKGTILTGANGQKYLAQSVLIVPGYTVSGTIKTAGSATVAITAAGTGSAFNTPGTTFTIAGWSGANAKLFYATSAGAVSGGQNSAMETLTTADQQQTIAMLSSALNEKLARETRSQIPATLITFPSLQFTTVNTNATVLQGTTAQFTATMQGTMVSYLLPRVQLQQMIASKAISDHLYPNVTIPELSSLQVMPVSPLGADPTALPNDIIVSLSGQGTVITTIPLSAVTQAVIGTARGSFNTALSKISEIDTASYSLRPFWAPYFPYKADRITVQVK